MARQWRTTAARWIALRPLAQKNRRESTPAEEVLWQAIRGGQIEGHKFRRQHAIDRFIVDFYCRQASLVIEVDGPVHKASRAEDAARQGVLEGQGLLILRFTNEDVMERLDEVLQSIHSSLSRSSRKADSGLPLSADGEGAGG